MKLKIIDNNDKGQNIYIYYDEKSSDAVIVDPGHNATEVLEFVKDLNVKKILLTHSHYDHIGDVNKVKVKTSAPICCHTDEKPLLQDPALNLSGPFFGEPLDITPDEVFDDNHTITIGDTTIKVIHTPGHTAGGACFYDEKNNVLFSGDTMFKRDIGRSDLPTGNGATLEASVRNKLLTLPNDTIVYPGHGPSTTIKDEKELWGVL